MLERVFGTSTRLRGSWRYCGPVSYNWRQLSILSRFDDRGARLEWSRTRIRVSGRIWTAILFDAPNWIFNQVQPQLNARGAKRVSLKEPTRQWLYAYLLPNGLDDPLERFLTLLADVVTIGRAPAPVDHCLALDLYKTPDPTTDSSRWPNTAAGSLVNRSKYWDPPGCVTAFQKLRTQMSRVVRDHPLLAKADSVLSIPGRRSGVAGHGERLARAVAEDVGKPFHPTSPLYDVREPAKQGFELRPEHVAVSGDLFFEDVLIIDDVFRSGSSMGAVARSASEAGALRIYGLVAAKTLRN
jgi:hypothetical protein